MLTQATRPSPVPVVTAGGTIVGITHDLDHVVAVERTVMVSFPVGRTVLLAACMADGGDTAGDVRAMDDAEFTDWALGCFAWCGVSDAYEVVMSPEFRAGYRADHPAVAEFYCVVRDRLDRIFPFEVLEKMA